MGEKLNIVLPRKFLRMHFTNKMTPGEGMRRNGEQRKCKMWKTVVDMVKHHAASFSKGWWLQQLESHQQRALIYQPLQGVPRLKRSTLFKVKEQPISDD